LPNGTVIPAGLYLDNAVFGRLDASKIWVNELSAISASFGTLKAKTANIDDLAVSTLKIQDEAVTVPAGVKLASPISTTAHRNPTVFTGGDAALVDTSNYFGDIVSISMRRSGGKCQISGYVYIDNISTSAWKSDGTAIPNAAKTIYCGVVLYRNGIPIFTGRVAASNEIINDAAIFYGAVQLPTIIDNAGTGDTKYTLRVGFSTTFTNGGVIVRAWSSGSASVFSATLSVLELKK